ncbi:hypothetical protein CN184_28300 [Sinorhizobium medicae]|uniref:phage tail terminator-like protein n=1 Tax=Sinorhizobium medicae TaxID=110321 RepID=UPI000FD2FD99|nr:phage tail terminator-like protein [Sinorhizobium medicae]RVJ16567.1 hypothetical protein CN184_28300 [Sinorhizobium medicae]
MASPQAYDAIHNYLVAAWGAATPLAFENDGFAAPSDPEHWIYVEIVGDVLEQESIGAENRAANLWREAGTIYAHVMTPRGAGTRQARVYAQQLVDLFRGQEIGTLTFLDCSIGASEPGDADGSYFRMTATIDWQRDL